MRRFIGLAAVVAALSLGGVADAALITRTFSIDATGFGATAPYQTVSGLFSVTFDNSASIANGTSDGLTVSNYALPAAPTSYAYSAAGDRLVIGFNTSVPAAGAIDCSLNEGQSCLKINQISTIPVGTSFSYNYGGVRTGRVIVLPQVAGAVPEPAAWATMLAGFGMAGAAMRRRRTVACPAR